MRSAAKDLLDGRTVIPEAAERLAAGLGGLDPRAAGHAVAPQRMPLAAGLAVARTRFRGSRARSQSKAFERAFNPIPHG